jgi:hypothetical protein
VIVPAEDIAQDELEELTAALPPVDGEGHSPADLEYRAKSGLDTYHPTYPDA